MFIYLFLLAFFIFPCLTFLKLSITPVPLTLARQKTLVQRKTPVRQIHARRGTRALPKIPVRLTLVVVDGAAVPAP